MHHDYSCFFQRSTWPSKGRKLKVRLDGDDQDQTMNICEGYCSTCAANTVNMITERLKILKAYGTTAQNDENPQNDRPS